MGWGLQLDQLGVVSGVKLGGQALDFVVADGAAPRCLARALRSAVVRAAPCWRMMPVVRAARMASGDMACRAARGGTRPVGVS